MRSSALIAGCFTLVISSCSLVRVRTESELDEVSTDDDWRQSSASKILVYTRIYPTCAELADSETEIVTTTMQILMTWYDRQLAKISLSGHNFKGDQFGIAEVWTPQLKVEDAIAMEFTASPSVLVVQDGYVTWSPTVSVVSQCDNGDCRVRLRLANDDDERIILKFLGSGDDGDIEEEESENDSNRSDDNGVGSDDGNDEDDESDERGDDNDDDDNNNNNRQSDSDGGGVDKSLYNSECSLMIANVKAKLVHFDGNEDTQDVFPGPEESNDEAADAQRSNLDAEAELRDNLGAYSRVGHDGIDLSFAWMSHSGTVSDVDALDEQ